MASLLLKSAYIGDVTALALVRTSYESALSLLAGIGPHLQWFSLVSGELLLSCTVFDGVRIHGIHVRENGGKQIEHLTDLREKADVHIGEEEQSVMVVVHGERKVKILLLIRRTLHRNRNGLEGSESAATGEAYGGSEWNGKMYAEDLGEDIGGDVFREDEEVKTIWSIPRFTDWVLDARLVTEAAESSLLAVGLSSNSVELLNWSQKTTIRRVSCSEQCLLYSMSLWGDSTDTLLVASGTIFNEVLIWPFRPSNGSMPEADIELSESVPEETDKETEIETDSNLLSGSTLQNQKSLLDAFLAATPICRLQGHEGSIYRLVWREDGNYIASVSDDRRSGTITFGCHRRTCVG